MADLREILNKYCAELPKLTSEANYFPTYLFEHFKEYYSQINESTNLMESLIEENQLVKIVDRKDTFCKQL